MCSKCFRANYMTLSQWHLRKTGFEYCFSLFCSTFESVPEEVVLYQIIASVHGRGYGGWSPALLHHCQDEVASIVGVVCLEKVGCLSCWVLCGIVAIRMLHREHLVYTLLSTFLASRTNFLIQHAQSSASISSCAVIIMYTMSRFAERGTADMLSLFVSYT